MKQRILYLIILLSVSFNLKSQEIQGGDITYKLIAPKQYKVSAKLWYNCAKTPLSSGKISIVLGGNTYSVTANKEYDTSYYKVCDTVSGNICSGSYGLRAAREVLFTATFDLNAAPYNTALGSNCDVYFYYTDTVASRVAGITTLSTPGKFYIEAMANVCKSFSASAFASAPNFQACCNQPVYLNANVSNAFAADSVSYKPYAVKTGFTSLATYAGSFSSQFPLTPYCPPNPAVVNCKPIPNAKPPRGFYFDPELGDAIFTPLSCSETSVLVVKAEYYQYDNAGVLQLVGFITRETALEITVCDKNNPPQIVASGLKTKFSVCEGNKLCFTVISSDVQFLPDQIVADTTDLSWNNTIPAATFTIIDSTARERSAQFCWQTQIGDARGSDYTFSAEAKDRNCPPAIVTKGFSINVLKRALSKRKYNILSGNRVDFSLVPDSVNAAYTATWEFRKDTTKGTPIATSMKRADTIVLAAQGTYYVTCVVANSASCLTQYVDTLYIGTNLSVQDLSLPGSLVSVYPNPVQGELQVAFKESVSNAEIEVLDMTSRLLYRSSFSGDRLLVDTHSWPTGIVLVKIKAAGVQGYYKLLVE